VQRLLQSYINCVSHDENIVLDLRHNIPWGQLRDNEEPIVWHDLILDQLWNKLEATFDASKQHKFVADIGDIHIQNVEMKKERIAALVAIFQEECTTNLDESTIYIDFNNANLCGEGIIFLSKLVDACSELQFFCLRHNRIDNMESACCLSRSLKLHSSIHNVHLDHCDLGSSPEIISIILQSDIKYINLSNNNIDSLGAVTIAEYLESDPPIDRIDLNHNRLSDDDVILISQALKSNTSLKTINLLSNNITSVGIKALLTCVFDSSSLHSISESNHTLDQMILFSYQKNGSLADSIDRLIELDRARKILLALNDKDSLLQYLANVPVELIPEMLTFPHGRQPVYLNIVYSTMRWWNMPMLYSYNCCV
jgi:Ran GTPase-activating protein (RanGAP) involved in mRNA processing and transport